MSAKLYKISGRFKSLLFITAVVLIGFLLVYTHKLVGTLREDARRILEFYAQFYARAADNATGPELNFIFEEIIKRTDFPIIQSDPEGTPTAWKGIEFDPEDFSEENIQKVRKLMNAMKKEIDPIPIKYNNLVLGYLYYGDSGSIRQLQWLPYVEIVVVGLFIMVGFFGFNSIRSSEQQFIWVGMAKETAHQLGTPISSLMGWTEVLKSREINSDQDTILEEMQRDIVRLEKVAQRFSKIGSESDLDHCDLDEIIPGVLEYFKRRLPQMGKRVSLAYENRLREKIPVNAALLEWVFENLIKNALDATDEGDGSITIVARPPEDGKYHAAIDIIDTGKGMDAHTRKNLFKPGFSTKKRGWGLGLSLARRIIEQYHHGRLLVKDSQPGKGTTMRILL